MVSILVAASYPLIQQGLRALLQGEPDLEWVGDARNAAELLARAAELNPDVCLVDTDVIDRRGAALLRELGRTAPQTSIVVITARDSTLPAVDLVRAGVLGLLPRAATATELAQTLRSAAARLLTIHPVFLDEIIDPEATVSSVQEPLAEPLTERELEVLKLLARGLPNKQIAAELAISEHTAKFHIRAILGKLGVVNRTEAVTAALQRGLVML